MVKQLLLIITGEFHLTEYKNLATDRTDWFNLLHKAPDSPEIRCKVRIEREDRIAILLEGEKEEIHALGEQLKRGPLTSHISSVEEVWREPKATKAPQGNRQGKPRRRRRRKRRKPA